ncbi:MAG TPA: hypothetical protein VNO52_01685, partial [Methylomirabilota bacterium]|nr:hypothetical protein [Methylomirabilota bacterium]
MEALGILIVGGFIVCVFVLPIAAFVRSGSVRRELEATRFELQTLTRRLTDLEQRLAAGRPGAPADGTATPAG